MRTPLVRRTATAGALVLSLAALSGCGSDSDEDPTSGSSEAPADEPSAEAESSESSESSEETDEEAESGEPIDQADFVALFEDAFDQATTATITLETGGQFSIEGTGAIDFTTTPLSMEMSMSIPQAPGPLELILADGVIYQGSGQAGGKFFAFDLDDPNSPFGSDFTEQLDPRASFDQFESGLQEVSLVGEEDGLTTYALTVDSAALLEGTEAEGQGGLPATIMYEMSIDEAGNFRSFTADLGPTAGTFEASYDNWGEPVDIKAPAQSEIADLPGQ